jgi:GNAT superfamily N-acetyltransferase
MLIADWPITKEYWTPFFRYICRCVKNGQYQKLKDVPVYRMHWNKDLLYVAGTCRGSTFEVIGWLCLEQKPGWQAWEIVQSFIFSDFRGQGWGKRLFTAVIELEGLLLASGYCQSRTARQLWKKLIVADRFTIWAHDFKNTDRHGPVVYDPESDALWSALPVYDNQQGRCDVRLLATKRR